MEDSKSFAAEVWQKLSAINVNDHTNTIKVGGRELTYLSWSWAWSVLMDHYPESTYEFESRQMPDDSWEVWCELVVRQGDDSVSRRMWLPVMNNQNFSVISPTTRQISDTRMRCLVKCLAVHGLGTYLYSGSELPEAEVKAAKEFIDQEQVDTLQSMLNALEATDEQVAKFCAAYDCEELGKMKAGQYQEAVSALVRKAKAVVKDSKGE